MQRFLRLVFAISLLSICKLLNAVGFYPYLFLKAERDTANISTFHGWFDFQVQQQALASSGDKQPDHAYRRKCEAPSGSGLKGLLKSLAVALPQRFIGINRS